jgi:hypothetical protein
MLKHLRQPPDAVMLKVFSFIGLAEVDFSICYSDILVSILREVLSTNFPLVETIVPVHLAALTILHH